MANSFIIPVIVVAVLLIAVASIVPFPSEAARAKLVAVLSDRLDGEVQLENLRVRVLPRLRVEGMVYPYDIRVDATCRR